MLFGKYASQKSEAKYPRLWDALEHSWFPTITGPSGTTVYDMKGNSPLIGNGFSAAAGWERLNGRWVYVNANTNQYFQAAKSQKVANTKSLTVSVYLNPVSWPGLNATICHSYGQWFLRQSGGGTTTGELLWANGTHLRRLTFPLWTGETRHLCAVVKNNEADGVWINGVRQAGTATNFITYSPVLTEPILVGLGEAANRYLNAKLGPISIWSRALSASEIMVLAKDYDAVHAKKMSINGGLTFNRRRRLLVGAGS
jgi:hypothetical protein